MAARTFCVVRRKRTDDVEWAGSYAWLTTAFGHPRFYRNMGDWPFSMLQRFGRRQRYLAWVANFWDFDNAVG